MANISLFADPYLTPLSFSKHIFSPREGLLSHISPWKQGSHIVLKMKLTTVKYCNNRSSWSLALPKLLICCISTVLSFTGTVGWWHIIKENSCIVFILDLSFLSPLLGQTCLKLKFLRIKLQGTHGSHEFSGRINTSPWGLNVNAKKKKE